MVSYYPLGTCLATLLVSFYFPTNCGQLANTTRPEVTIPQGTLSGIIMTTLHGRNVSAFLKVPFAQPPIGNLRFANPVAADGWNGTLDASVDPSMCPQIYKNAIVGDEDCLYVNVYTPQNENSLSLLPVMVYIHGGAFKTESQISTTAGPQFILDADVVYVAPNYRLGPLGFLSTGDHVASGNWGLKDLVLALEWVRDNVQYFRGDPTQVTIFGESAGAGAIHLLTLSDTTIGLFHRYITQSGSALAPWSYQPRAKFSEHAFKLGKFVGCFNDTSDSLISCLRTREFTDIIATHPRFLVWKSFPDVVWPPTNEPDIEGAFLTDSPANLLAAGKIRDLPWMSGVSRDEGLVYSSLCYRDEEYFKDFLNNIDTALPPMLLWMFQTDSVDTLTKAAKSFYFNNDLTSDRSELLANLTMLISDSYFWYPLRNALQQHHALAVHPQYFYLFSYRGTNSYSSIYGGSRNYGVAHADELIYLFPKAELLSDFNYSMSETDYKMVDTVVQLWTSFAITGIPTASALSGGTVWEPYSSADGYLRIGNNTDVGLEVEHSFFPERMQFWANIDAYSETQSKDSGTSTSYANLLTLLLVVSSKFVLSATTSDTIG